MQPSFSLRRRWAYWALTGMGAILLCALFGEVFLRLRWTPPKSLTTPAFSDHLVYASAPIPGIQGRQVTTEYNAFFAHNRFGMRGDDPVTGQKAEGDPRRVLLLGDSHTYGLGVDQADTFAQILAADRPPGTVVNAGSNGYGTRNSLAVLDHFGGAWSPDDVVLVFFWNDLEDNIKRTTPDFALVEGRVVRRDSPNQALDPLAPQPQREVQPHGNKGLRLRAFLKDGLRGVRYRLLGIKPRKIQTAEQKERAWEETERQLNLVLARCQELDARLHLVWLPDQSQVDPDLKIDGIGPMQYDIEALLKGWCTDQAVAYQSLLPALVQAFDNNPDDKLFYYADRHMTPRGHAVAGAAIIEWLRQ